MIQGKYLLVGEDYTECRKIRNEVFILEQGVSEEIEYDEYDDKAIHVIIGEDGKFTATGRLIKIDDNFKIGRIAVKKEERGKGYGDFVVRMLCDKAFLFGAKEVYASVQLQARGFYEKIGFVPYGEEYMEADISHIMMKLTKESVCKQCDKK